MMGGRFPPETRIRRVGGNHQMREINVHQETKDQVAAIVAAMGPLTPESILRDLRASGGIDLNDWELAPILTVLIREGRIEVYDDCESFV